MGLGFFGKKAAAQSANASAGSGGKKRARFPYTKRDYFPDEQSIFDEDDQSATVEIISTKQQMLVDKPSRTVFTMDDEPLEIGVWLE